MTEISIVIPTYNRGAVFDQCIHSIVQSIDDKAEVIVINDSNTTSPVIPEDKRVKLFQNIKSGAASARNYGASLAKGRVLLFIDDDMIVNRGAIYSCLDILDNSPAVCINSDWVYTKTNIEKIQETSFGRYLIKIGYTSLEGWNTGMVWKKNDILEAKGVTSQFLMINKRDFEFIGGYNEKFPFAGYEDTEFYSRLERNNFRVLINTSVQIFHNEMDRLNYTAYIQRRERGAYTRKVANQLGVLNTDIRYSYFKRNLYRFLLNFETPLHFLVNNFPNIYFLDRLYSFIINLTVGMAIFKGINKGFDEHKKKNH